MHLALPAAIACVFAFAVDSHGDIPGSPKLFGRSARIATIRSRLVRSETWSPEIEQGAVLMRGLDTRATDRCGKGNKLSCGPNLCCSSAGYCGIGVDYCTAPDCQVAYGPGCDGNKIPAGASTVDVPRPLIGSQPYGGGGIYDCVVDGVVALTFDDGPYIYTSGILDILKQYNAKATFFITGINIGKGAIDDSSKPWPDLIRRMYAEGHQIASHTWSHQDLSLTTETTDEEKLRAESLRRNQMYYNEMAIQNLLGFFPTYMRPPYSSCDSACQGTLQDLGYHIVYFDLDTDDYNQDSPSLIQNSKNRFARALQGQSPSNTDFLAIAHDIHEQTAYNLTNYMLEKLLSSGYRPVTVGECLADPAENWYRTAGGGGASPPTSSATPTPNPKPVTRDATCASNGNGATCQGSQWGDCCSHAGWCGSTDDYCNPYKDCQPNFGTCARS